MQSIAVPVSFTVELHPEGADIGSRRTVESYSPMLWHFFKGTTPDQVSPAIVLAYAHGIGLSGKTPSPVTIEDSTVYYSYRGKVASGVDAELRRDGLAVSCVSESRRTLQAAKIRGPCVVAALGGWRRPRQERYRRGGFAPWTCPCGVTVRT